MAVSVDRVYQTVLTLLNKEQRGYLPQKEFNQLAQQAQVEIFENYFFELGRATAQYGEMSPEYSSIADNIFEKLEEFEVEHSLPDPVPPAIDSDGISATGQFNLNMLPDPGLYRLQTITSNQIEVVRKKHREIGYMLRSPLTSPVASMPLYIRQGNLLTFYPNRTTHSFDTGDDTEDQNITGVVINYIRNLSSTPMWTGVVMDGQIVYNEAGSTDFELHPSEEPELVAKILDYAGLTVKSPDVNQFAGAKDQQISQSES